MLGQLEIKKVHEKSWQTIDTNKGVYKCFAKLVEGQGFTFDPKGAVRRAQNHACKCLQMAGRWVSRNDMTEEIEFLEMNREHTELFTEKWGLYETEQKNNKETEAATNAASSSTPDAASSSTPDAAAAAPNSTGGAKAKAKASGKAKAKAAGSCPNSKSPSEKTGKLKLNDTLSRGVKFRIAYQTVTSAAATLQRQIEGEDPSWQWANNDCSLGKLKESTSELSNAMTPFAKKFMITDPKGLGKKMGDELFVVSLEERC